MSSFIHHWHKNEERRPGQDTVQCEGGRMWRMMKTWQGVGRLNRQRRWLLMEFHLRDQHSACYCFQILP